MYIHIHAYIYTHRYIHIYVYVYTHMYSNIFTCTYVYTQVFIVKYVLGYEYIYIYVYIYIYIYMYIHIYVYINIYTLLYTSTMFIILLTFPLSAPAFRVKRIPARIRRAHALSLSHEQTQEQTFPTLSRTLSLLSHSLSTQQEKSPTKTCLFPSLLLSLSSSFIMYIYIPGS